MNDWTRGNMAGPPFLSSSIDKDPFRLTLSLAFSGHGVLHEKACPSFGHNVRSLEWHRHLLLSLIDLYLPACLVLRP